MFFNIIYYIELLGTVVFAISGVLVAHEKRLDLFGAAVLGCSTAVGGGIIRDLLLGITPPQMFRNPTYVLLALITSLLSFLFLYIRKRRYIATWRKAENGTPTIDDKTLDELSSNASVENPIPRFEKTYNYLMNAFDGLGLAVFAISGVQTACSSGYRDSFFLCMFIGLMTAVGGGVIRDILASQTPVILRKNIYALAALLCCIIYYVCILPLHLNVITSIVIATAVTVTLRHLSYAFDWNMPTL